MADLALLIILLAASLAVSALALVPSLAISLVLYLYGVARFRDWRWVAH